MYLHSDRSFQVWCYSVSHGQLLIRSPKSRHDPENIDVAFFGVTMMLLPGGFFGLTVEDALPKEIEDVREKIRDPSSVQRVYALVSEGRRHLVAAADVRVSQNTLDFRETDLDFFGFVKPGQRIIED
jgi:hypothetical protein